jgi:hypothetical protein
MLGLTVLVVDADAHTRAQLVGSLRALGLHAVGVYEATDAVALLDGITPDAVLARVEAADVALRLLRTCTLLVEVRPSEPVEDALSALLQALGHTPRADAMN